MANIVLDSVVESALHAERKSRGLDKRDEVWDGVSMIMPLPNVEHQEIAAELWLVFHRLSVSKVSRSMVSMSVIATKAGLRTIASLMWPFSCKPIRLDDWTRIS